MSTPPRVIETTEYLRIPTAAVLAEFEELSREFAVWSFAKSQKDDETNYKTLRTTIQELEEEEKKQGERSHEEVGLTEVEVVPDTSLSTLTTLRAPRMPELHRQKISSFLDTFKHAFKVLIG